MIILSVVLTGAIYFLNETILRLFGASNEILSLGIEYISVIVLGASLQVLGTGIVPFIRNNGGSFYAMISMIAGFVTNIFLDYLFVWVFELELSGAAWATVIGQGVAMLIVLIYLLRKKQFTLKIQLSKIGSTFATIAKIGVAPFGLTMTPNISLIIINRFSVFYGGDIAIAAYACIGYVICIIYLILQGVGDGSQPLISKYFGEKDFRKMKNTRWLAYGFAMLLSIIGCIVMLLIQDNLGMMFGSSDEVNSEIAKTMPIFLVSVPFVLQRRTFDRKEHLLLYPYVYRTRADVSVYADFAVFVRRSDHDLVEYCYRAHYVCGTGGDPAKGWG